MLADFVAKFSPRSEVEVICHVDCRLWKVFMDGALSAMRAGAEIGIITPEGIRVGTFF